MYISDESSFIAAVDYDNGKLTVWFKKYWTDQLDYFNVPPEVYEAFIMARSKGRFYLSNIKSQFKTTQKMADRVIKCKIDVTKVNRDWFFSGTKGTYMNFTVLFNEKPDDYGNHGMIVQDVPTELYKKDKTVRGNILGNCKTFAATVDKEAMPGQENGKMVANMSAEEKAKWNDDLPF